MIIALGSGSGSSLPEQSPAERAIGLLGGLGIGLGIVAPNRRGVTAMAA
jgi:hypothetical protein